MIVRFGTIRTHQCVVVVKIVSLQASLCFVQKLNQNNYLLLLTTKQINIIIQNKF